jgi:two-component system, response regulator
MNEGSLCEILLIEDDDVDAEFTVRALHKHHLANDIVRLKDGEEALDFIFRRGPYAAREDMNPRLVLLDLDLPKINGIEVLRAIRSNERTEHIPVVVLTASEEDKDAVESYLLRVNSYLVKPIGFSEFVDVVAQVGFFWGLLDRLPA